MIAFEKPTKNVKSGSPLPQRILGVFAPLKKILEICRPA